MFNMKITSDYSTTNFQARFKMKSPKLQKLKNETAILKDMPEIKKTAVSLGFSLGGTATFCSGNYIQSAQAIPLLKEGLPLLGTTVSQLPLLAAGVAESNNDSGTKSSVSFEESLFHKNSIEDKKLPS